jgi:hypothetical protein
MMTGLSEHAVVSITCCGAFELNRTLLTSGFAAIAHVPSAARPKHGPFVASIRSASTG